MEEYKQYLFGTIVDYRDETIEQVEEHIKNHPNYTINRNEEGKMHSHYLGDRYEPAIIEHDGNYIRHYYLFDGDIKDCENPFCIVYNGRNLHQIIYYSSERIKSGKPIYIDNEYLLYNHYNNEKILDEYESNTVRLSDV